MAANVFNSFGFVNAAGALKQPLVNDDLRVEMYALGGKTAAYNKTASAVIKASAGRLMRINVLTAGSAPGAVHNCATTGAAAAGNLIFNVPNTVGTYVMDWPCDTGIVYILGTGQVCSFSFI
jgi:hypothetical protein